MDRAIARRRSTPALVRRALALGVLACSALVVLVGCSRARYRAAADRDTYGVLEERLFDPRWQIPRRPVWPMPQSRFRDLSNPDRGPLPPDDPAAHRYMRHPYRFTGWKGWDRRGMLPWIEDPAWLACLARDEQGAVRIGRDNAMGLALVHSREYQSQVEQLYLQSLALTLERFQLDTQWFAGNRTGWTHLGNSSLPEESNLLSTTNSARVQRSLAGGGQLVAEFANNFVWEFTGKNISRASGGVLVSLTQPLLRGAYKQIRLESLTQTERNVLYAVRGFARFRRIFYVNVMGSNGFLGLLAQLQSIRNQEFNLQNLERSLREYEALYDAGLVSLIEVDSVFQNYQSARLGLLQAQLGFQNALDQYKLVLGLPPQMEVRLDGALLNRFELNDPRLDGLRERNEALNLTLVQTDEPPTVGALRDAFGQLRKQQEELATALGQIEQELAQWRGRLKARKGQPSATLPGGTGPGDLARRLRDDVAEQARQTKVADALTKELVEVREKLTADGRDTARAAEALGEETRRESWTLLLDQAGKEFRARVGDAFVIQTQARVYLIELPAWKLEPARAVEMALANRLDLMNQRGLVMDAYRRVEVAGNALKGTLNVQGTANLLTDPNHANPVGFDPSFNRYTLGLEFDSPLTRRLERNAFRAAQIGYQQARRAYMAAEDGIARDIRSQLRSLEISRFRFEVARLQLVAAARQVDEAQISLRSGQPGGQTQSATLFLLQAFQSLLGAKNGLISGWVDYENTRMTLVRDLDLMEIDAQGNWLNERDQPGTAATAAEEVPGVVEGARRNGGAQGSGAGGAGRGAAAAGGDDSGSALLPGGGLGRGVIGPPPVPPALDAAGELPAPAN